MHMATTPTLQDKAPKPVGLLPKNVQSWLLAGLAVVMVLIMWVTGGKKPVPSKAAPPAPVVLPPLEVNEAKIVELQKRIEDLQREQIVAQNALAQQSRVLGSAAETQAVQPSPAYANSPERPEDAIQAERK